MARYRFIWRAVPEQSVIHTLDAEGIYITTGGPRTTNSEALRHQVETEAESKEAAAEKIRAAIKRAGGNPSDLEDA